jgi:cation transport ATPase
MEIYLGPVLFTSLGLLYMTNPLGLGDAAFRQLNKYPRINWSAEAARQQAFVLGRTFFAIGTGALIWVLLLEFEASHPAKVAFLAAAIPSALALALFTIIDTNRRAAEQRRP